MKRYLAYLKSVLRHKRFVYEECLKLGVPRIVAILHDWDKFLPDEFIPYAKCFYKPDGSKQYDEQHMIEAWMKHQHRNKHHWQYWVKIYDEFARLRRVLIWDRGDITVFARDEQGKWQDYDFSRLPVDSIAAVPMPDLYRREMLADWRGAGRAYGNPDTKGWYLERRDTVFAKFVHPDTLKWLDEQLGV